MEWIQALRNGIDRGRHALVCTGSVTDAFPATTFSSTAFPDHLLSWDECVRVAIPHLCGWTFDPAFGFRFHDEASQTIFHQGMFGSQKTKDQDPIAAARATVQERTLPTDPLSALRLVREVCDRLCEDTTMEQAEVRCLVILPNLDVWCSPRPQQMNDPGTLALILESFFTNEQYRRQGIVFLASTSVMEGLHERLRQRDIPLMRVHVTRPNEEERQQFVAQLCNHDQPVLCAELARLQTQRETISARVIHESAQRHAELKQQMYVVNEQIRMKAAGVRDVRRAIENRDAAVAALQGLQQGSERDQRLSQLHESIRRLKTASLQHVVHVHVRNALTIAKQMRVGDALQMHAGYDGIYYIQQVGVDGAFVLRQSTENLPSLDAVHKPQMFRFTRGPNQRFGFEVRINASQWSEYTPFARMDVSAYPIYIPKSDVEFVQQLDEFERERTSLEAMHTERLQQAHERVQMSDRQILSMMQKHLPADFELKKFLIETMQSMADYVRHPEHHPDVKALDEQIREQQMLLNSLIERGFCPVPEQGILQAAYDLHGLGYRHIASLLLDSRAKQMSLTRDEILQARIVLLRQSYGHLFEIVDPTYGFEGIGGLDHIKTYFTEVRDAIVRKEWRAVPMGTLLMGPPGTGKTAIAEAFARECGFLYVKIRNTRSMWLGESERIAAEMFATLRDLAPVVVLRDEVDQEDTGRDQFQGDSGVGARLRGAWMQFLSDPTIRGQIFVVSCSNRPDLLDAALKRAGRTDERIPVLMPDAVTRASVFAVMMYRYKYPFQIESFAPFADRTKGRSGADIEVMVRRAYQHAIQLGGDAITPEALAWAIDDYLDEASQRDIARMTLTALRATSSRRFLPADEAELILHCKEILSHEPNENHPLPKA